MISCFEGDENLEIVSSFGEKTEHTTLNIEQENILEGEYTGREQKNILESRQRGHHEKKKKTSLRVYCIFVSRHRDLASEDI